MNTPEQVHDQSSNIEFITNVNAKLKILLSKKESDAAFTSSNYNREEALTATNFTKLSRQLNVMDFSNTWTEALKGCISV